MTVAHLNSVSTAVPDHDIHDAYLSAIVDRLERREAVLFRRMASRAGISHRFSVFAPAGVVGEAADSEGFFKHGEYPGTRPRMERYEREAPVLALKAIAGLDLDPGSITHLIVASCTGFMAPGLDQRIVEGTGISPAVERTVIGFMGCYAAVNSLRLAHHIVRSEPEAQVLVVSVELCSLHFQEHRDLERNLSSMLFGDGAAAALVSSNEKGLALLDFRSLALSGSGELITWRIGEQGFDMHLSGEVPQRIEVAMRAEAALRDGVGVLRGLSPEEYELWAVHAGGRTILDAVEGGFGLGNDALAVSRGILNDFGNMSSATLLFVLQRILAGDGGPGSRGMGLAFGPGLAAESFRFTRL